MLVEQYLGVEVLDVVMDEKNSPMAPEAVEKPQGLLFIARNSLVLEFEKTNNSGAAFD